MKYKIHNNCVVETMNYGDMAIILTVRCAMLQ